MISQLTGKYLANEIIYQNTDTNEPTLEAITDVPAKGELVKPEPELVPIKTARNSARTPNDNIDTREQNDFDKNNSEDETCLNTSNG